MLLMLSLGIKIFDKTPNSASSFCDRSGSRKWKEKYVNRQVRTNADAVLFHAPDLNSSNIPKRLRVDQIWILYSMEPPRYAVLKWHFD
ncbi:hypothetical protein CEXT_402681 [Caerostris extrusa]|uniref:Fucosyltransferase N-terminal domain-containing protein n=1 Tax=Caerostris extrusa TaxID=172846 RepID=A0AAV4VUP1_CAEEX|nr:hypothetical protein CEXT_402681 [Caerostris extrusa]